LPYLRALPTSTPNVKGLKEAAARSRGHGCLPWTALPSGLSAGSPQLRLHGRQAGGCRRCEPRGARTDHRLSLRRCRRQPVTSPCVRRGGSGLPSPALQPSTAPRRMVPRRPDRRRNRTFWRYPASGGLNLRDTDAIKQHIEYTMVLCKDDPTGGATVFNKGGPS
jgi:hypothetical protein